MFDRLLLEFPVFRADDPDFGVCGRVIDFRVVVFVPVDIPGFFDERIPGVFGAGPVPGGEPGFAALGAALAVMDMSPGGLPELPMLGADDGQGSAVVHILLVGIFIFAAVDFAGARCNCLQIQFVVWCCHISFNQTPHP